jgi:ABC-type molybdate transport system substrate-binding protein
MKRSLRLLLLFASLSFLLARVVIQRPPTPMPITLNVFAAASLTEPFNAIATVYHQQPW